MLRARVPAASSQIPLFESRHSTASQSAWMARDPTDQRLCWPKDPEGPRAGLAEDLNLGDIHRSARHRGLVVNAQSQMRGDRVAGAQPGPRRVHLILQVVGAEYRAARSADRHRELT